MFADVDFSVEEIRDGVDIMLHVTIYVVRRLVRRWRRRQGSNLCVQGCSLLPKATRARREDGWG